MQLPSFDRTPNVRPAGADLASSMASRVIPVAPVNPSVQANTPVANTPSVINMVNPALRSSQGDAVYAMSADPAIGGSEDATAPKDWTIHRPPVERTEDPPPKPMSQILMEHIRSMWNASANAVQVEQVSNQLNPPASWALMASDSAVSKQMLTYTPSKVKKTEVI
jgi:hypothetical protein